MDKIYLTKARYDAYLAEIDYMEGEGGRLMAQLLASSPGSGMGRPNDLPVHQIAGEFRGYLQDIKHIVSVATIIDDLRAESSECEEVTLGSTVTVSYPDDDDMVEYTILGRHEVDVPKGRISCWSPIGSTLINGRKGERVAARLSDTRELEMAIVDIELRSLDYEYSHMNWRDRLESIAV